MPRIVSGLTATAAAAASSALVLVLLLVPGTGPAGAASSCIAWAALPHRVALAGHEVAVRATLSGTPACRGVTADSGGSATLDGPGPSTSDFPLRWRHLGGSDTAPMYASLDALGTYRIADGTLHTYDAEYMQIPYTWRATQTVVKYAGRFAHVSLGGGAVSARLLYYAKYGWSAHAGVRVLLQRQARDGTWRTIGRERSSGTGWVRFGARPGSYRLVSRTTASVWSATAGVSSRA